MAAATEARLTRGQKVHATNAAAAIVAAATADAPAKWGEAPFCDVQPASPLVQAGCETPPVVRQLSIDVNGYVIFQDAANHVINVVINISVIFSVHDSPPP